MVVCSLLPSISALVGLVFVVFDVEIRNGHLLRGFSSGGGGGENGSVQGEFCCGLLVVMD